MARRGVDPPPRVPSPLHASALPSLANPLGFLRPAASPAQPTAAKQDERTHLAGRRLRGRVLSAPLPARPVLIHSLIVIMSLSNSVIVLKRARCPAPPLGIASRANFKRDRKLEPGSAPPRPGSNSSSSSRRGANPRTRAMRPGPHVALRRAASRCVERNRNEWRRPLDLSRLGRAPAPPRPLLIIHYGGGQAWQAGGGCRCDAVCVSSP